MAKTLIENYRPLVEMEILTSDGVLISKKSMNDDIMKLFPSAEKPDEPLVASFLKFLDSSSTEKINSE